MATNTVEHEMLVADPRGAERFVWNGVPEERAQVKAAFDERMSTGLFLAYKTVEPKRLGRPAKHVQIREFEPEADQIILTPRLVGG